MGSVDRSNLPGLRHHLIRALAPALALTVLAGSAAATVTLVRLTSEVGTTETGTTDHPSDADAAEVDDPSTVAATEVGADPEIDAVGADDEERPDEPTPLTFDEAVAAHGPPDYAAILTRRYPGAQWSLNGNDPTGLRWIGPGSRPSRDELDAHWPSVADELAAERAAERAAEAAAAAQREAELAARRSDPAVNALLDSFDPRTIWGPTPDYAHVLTRRFPGAQWSLNGNDPVGGLSWMGPGPKPSKAELDALWADVAREMALEMDPKELARWAGTGDQIYVDGVLRPRGWVGGANDPQPAPLEVTEDNWRYLPQLPNDGGGGSIDIYKDPTGAKNFEQMYGTSLEALVRAISAAHGNWGNQYGGLGLSMNGDRTLIWYSSQVDRNIVVSILTSMGALPADRSAPAPEAQPEPQAEVEAEGGSSDQSGAAGGSVTSDEGGQDTPSED